MNAPDLCVFAGITYRQLDFWTARGLLLPYGRVKASSGRPREYPESETLVARRMAELIKAGLQLRTAHDIARGSITATQALRRALEAAG